MRKSGFPFLHRRHANALRLQALSMLFLVPAVIFFVRNGFAQEAYRSPSIPEPSPERPPEMEVSALKKLPLEELVDIEVSSASRRPEKLSETSSAVDVITSEDIARAGVTSLPDTLRLGDLPWNLQFVSVLRYVDDLPKPHTPSYLTADLRIAWWPRKNIETAIVGRNLFEDAHPQFRQAALTREVEQSVLATFKWSY